MSSRVTLVGLVVVVLVSVAMSATAEIWDMGRYTYSAYPGLDVLDGPRYEFTPFVGYRFGADFEDQNSGESYDVSGGASYGIAADYRLTERSMLEFLWTRQDSEVEIDSAGIGDVDLSIDHFTIGGVYEYPYERFLAFASGGIGMTYVDADDGDSTSEFALNLGAGAKVYLTEHIGLRADLRGMATFVDSSTSVYAGQGLVVGFSSDVYWQGEATAGVVICW